MDAPLSTLLAALATAEGDTIPERIEALITAGKIYTPDLSKVRAAGIEISAQPDLLEAVALDIEAWNLSRRLRNISRDISPEKIRDQPQFWSPRFVGDLEALHRQGQEMRHPRRLRVAR
jgi:hypothetical protein